MSKRLEQALHNRGDTTPGACELGCRVEAGRRDYTPTEGPTVNRLITPSAREDVGPLPLPPPMRRVGIGAVPLENCSAVFSTAGHCMS